MKIIKTDIIPVKLWYYNKIKNTLLSESYHNTNEKLDYESIAFFASTGFFFSDSTFFKNIKVVPPATNLQVGDNGQILSMNSYWEWYYNPIIRDVEEATEVFKMGFESNLFKTINGKKVIFPLSGGIDSRTIAAALPDGMPNLNTYSYEFEGGVKEVWYGKSIAKKKKFPFKAFTIPQGYLWNKIDEISKLVKYETEFTHSRQIAVLDEIEKLGEIFVLGHGGEIFIAPKVDKDISFEGLVDYLFNMFVKDEGLALGEKLWQVWGLKGKLKDYIKDNFALLLHKISIKEANPRLRAFLYKYIAYRKNQVNINIFERHNEIYLPFLNRDVLNGICNVHEDVLIDRKVQINYIKQKSPAIASIPWQNYYPLNLYNYEKFSKKTYLPKRALYAFKRVVNEKMRGKKLITRNWENQLLGEENDKKLQSHLFSATLESNIIPKDIIKEVYENFKYKDSKANITPLSTLITITNFEKKLVKQPQLQKKAVA
ncbi:MAG: asparagine synthase-related protein [Bacteroidota bacterium]|nr:asparagine synthase-related protein [Bacteroidota bacterium]